MSNVRSIDLVRFRKNVDTSFSLSELKVLCFELDIDFEKISGSEKDEKTVELVRYCQRHGKLLDLMAYCSNARPHLEWSKNLQPEHSSKDAQEDRKRHFQKIQQISRYIQLVHTIRPSGEKNGHWEILIYLVRQDSDDLSIIDYAEFFLGPYWDNRIFKASNYDNFVGIATLAWGAVMCTCRVVFLDGQEVMLNRYIDLEMVNHLPDKKILSRLFENLTVVQPKIEKENTVRLKIWGTRLKSSSQLDEYKEMERFISHRSPIDLDKMVKKHFQDLSKKDD